MSVSMMDARKRQLPYYLQSPLQPASAFCKKDDRCKGKGTEVLDPIFDTCIIDQHNLFREEYEDKDPFAEDGTPIERVCYDVNTLWKWAKGKPNPTYPKTRRSIGPTAMHLLEERVTIVMAHDGPVLLAVPNHDGSQVVSAGNDGTMHVWDVLTRKIVHVLRGHTLAVISAKFSADGSRIVSASDDGSVRVWDALSGQSLRVLLGYTTALSVEPFAISADGSNIVSAGEDGSVRVWDAQTGEMLRVLTGLAGRMVVFVAVSPDGQRIVFAGHRTLHVWSATTGTIASTRIIHEDGDDVVAMEDEDDPEKEVTSAAISPDGKRVVVACVNGTVFVFDTETNALLHKMEHHTDREPIVNSVAFNHDGTQFVSASDDRTVRVWDPSDGREIHRLNYLNPSRPHSAKFSPDGSRIVSVHYPGTVCLWNAENGHLLRTLDGHTGVVYDCSFDPQGRWVVTASEDKTIRIWDLTRENEAWESDEDEPMAGR